MKKIKFGNRVIGQGEPIYFIADIGANHDGDITKAYKLIELAEESGADAAKFQNFQAAKIVSKVGFEKFLKIFMGLIFIFFQFLNLGVSGFGKWFIALYIMYTYICQ